MKSVKYLERVRATLDKQTDAELANKIGVGKSAVSHYMKGIRVMDEETCLAVALALQIDPLEVVMAAGIDRANKAGQKSLWEVFSARNARTASVILGCAAVTLFLTVAPEPAQAAALRSQFDNNTNYAKIKRRLSAVLARLKRMVMPGALEPAAA